MKLAVVVLVVALAAAVLAEEQVPATPLGGPCGGAPCPPAGAAAAGAQQSSIADAVQPVDDWIKGFNKKMGMGENLYGAARVIVKPLIKKLRRTQKRALQRLKASNHQILEHVEEEAVDHVYSLLRAGQMKAKADASVEKKKLKLAAMKEKLTNEKKAAKLAAKQVKKAKKLAKKEAKAAKKAAKVTVKKF